MPTKTMTIDVYLKSLPTAQRQALEKLRRTIQATAPKAEEGESYGLPAFRLNGKPLVAFSAAAQHCSFFPMDGSTTGKFAKELSEFSISKGTIRFTPDRPLPAALIKKIVQSRIADLGSLPPAKKKPAKKSTSANGEFADFFTKLKHPLAADYDVVRKAILAVSPKITAGIKWNSVSFRTTEWFATINWRARDTVQLVFHLGAKVKDNSKALTIADSAGMIKWLAKDRCLVTLGKGPDVKKNSKALQSIVRSWIKYV